VDRVEGVDVVANPEAADGEVVAKDVHASTS
jgi:hypothetical protein